MDTAGPLFTSIYLWLQGNGDKQDCFVSAMDMVRLVDKAPAGCVAVFQRLTELKESGQQLAPSSLAGLDVEALKCAAVILDAMAGTMPDDDFFDRICGIVSAAVGQAMD